MRIVLIFAVLALGGCSSAGDFLGSPHGYIGDIDTPVGLTINGVPTIFPDGTLPLGYRNGDIEGAFNTITTADVTATGMVAIVLACNGDEGCIRAVLGM